MVNEVANNRFVLEVDGRVSELVYVRDGDRIDLVHTRVPEDQRGRGYAERLVQAALGEARAQGLTVVPSCSYVRQLLASHPGDSSSVSIDWGARLS